MEKRQTPKPPLEKQMAKADFGDQRLTDRAVQVVKRLQSKPSVSFPEAMVTSAEIEGYYRFIGNKKVDAKRLLEPHSDEVVQQASTMSRPRVLHDSSEVGLTRIAGASNDLYRLSKGKYGVGIHCSLVVNRDNDSRDVVGVGRLEFFDPNFQPDTKTRYKRYRHPDNIKWRWLNGIVEMDEAFKAAGAKPIHVADSEVDSFDRLASFTQKDIDVVIRSKYDRRLDIDEDSDKPGTLYEAVKAEPVEATRQVTLTKRHHPEGTAPQRSQRHPSRDERQAELEVRSCRVQLARAKTKGLLTDAKRVCVNAIWVYESDPPEGTEPVDWLVLTTLKIETTEQVLDIIDIYRDRWMIEEFFKCLKTGAALEKRQLEFQRTLRNATALLAPIAVDLLRLRYQRDPAEPKPAKQLFTKIFLEAVAVQCQIDNVDIQTELTTEQLYKTIARLGGHIKQNGPPGWQVLWRGMKKIKDTEDVLKVKQNSTKAKM